MEVLLPVVFGVGLYRAFQDARADHLPRAEEGYRGPAEGEEGGETVAAAAAAPPPAGPRETMDPYVDSPDAPPLVLRSAWASAPPGSARVPAPTQPPNPGYRAAPGLDHSMMVPDRDAPLTTDYDLRQTQRFQSMTGASTEFRQRYEPQPLFAPAPTTPFVAGTPAQSDALFARQEFADSAGLRRDRARRAVEAQRDPGPAPMDTRALDPYLRTEARRITAIAKDYAMDPGLTGAAVAGGAGGGGALPSAAPRLGILDQRARAQGEYVSGFLWSIGGTGRGGAHTDAMQVDSGREAFPSQARFGAAEPSGAAPPTAEPNVFLMHSDSADVRRDGLVHGRAGLARGAPAMAPLPLLPSEGLNNRSQLLAMRDHSFFGAATDFLAGALVPAGTSALFRPESNKRERSGRPAGPAAPGAAGPAAPPLLARQEAPTTKKDELLFSSDGFIDRGQGASSYLTQPLAPSGPARNPYGPDPRAFGVASAQGPSAPAPAPYLAMPATARDGTPAAAPLGASAPLGAARAAQLGASAMPAHTRFRPDSSAAAASQLGPAPAATLIQHPFSPAQVGLLSTRADPHAANTDGFSPFLVQDSRAQWARDNPLLLGN